VSASCSNTFSAVGRQRFLQTLQAKPCSCDGYHINCMPLFCNLQLQVDALGLLPFKLACYKLQVSTLLLGTGINGEQQAVPK
jgi:hypothetical protein